MFGRRFTPPEAVKPLGNVPQLGKDAQKRIPNARLVEFENVGHVPHLEAPNRFHAAVLAFLSNQLERAALSADPDCSHFH